MSNEASLYLKHFWKRGCCQVFCLQVLSAVLRIPRWLHSWRVESSGLGSPDVAPVTNGDTQECPSFILGVLSWKNGEGKSKWQNAVAELWVLCRAVPGAWCGWCHPLSVPSPKCARCGAEGTGSTSSPLEKNLLSSQEGPFLSDWGLWWPGPVLRQGLNSFEGKIARNGCCTCISTPSTRVWDRWAGPFIYPCSVELNVSGDTGQSPILLSKSLFNDYSCLLQEQIISFLFLEDWHEPVEIGWKYFEFVRDWPLPTSLETELYRDGCCLQSSLNNRTGFKK